MIALKFMPAKGDGFRPADVTWNGNALPATGDVLRLDPDSRNPGGVAGVVISRIFLAPGIVILVGDWRTSAELAHIVGFSTEAA